VSWLDHNEFRGLSPDLLSWMKLAEREWKWVEEASAKELVALASKQLRLDITAVDATPENVSALEFGNLLHVELTEIFEEVVSSRTSLAEELADQVQLCRAFSDPAQVLDVVTKRVAAAASRFPRNAADLKVAIIKGDVLDPFILAAKL